MAQALAAVQRHIWKCTTRPFGCRAVICCGLISEAEAIWRSGWWRCQMKTRIAVLLLGLGLGAQSAADSRAGVWVYQPDGGSYRVETRPYQYDPRSPYSQHRQYQQNLPPRYHGQLPPQYYDRHRGSDRHRWKHDRRGDFIQRPRWRDERRSGFDHPSRWDRHPSRHFGRPPLVRDGRDFRMHQRRDFHGRYERH